MRFLSPYLLLSATLSVSTTAAPSVEFNRDIRPLLSDRCFFCHGPDEKPQEILS